jgi:hypothetical protein
LNAEVLLAAIDASSSHAPPLRNLGCEIGITDWIGNLSVNATAKTLVASATRSLSMTICPRCSRPSKPQ